jgi:hypothetical protein
MRTLRLFSCLPLFAGAAFSQAGGVTGPEPFAKEFVEAINSHSVARRLEVLHEKSRACINPQTQPFFDWVFSRQTEKTIPANYRVIAVKPFPKNHKQPLQAHYSYPTQPTHTLEIGYQNGTHSSSSFILMIAPDGDRWREVLPCPGPEAIEGAERSDAERRMQHARAEALVNKLEPALRAEVEELIRGGRRVDAIRRLSAAADGDLAVARRAVDRLTSLLEGR